MTVQCEECGEIFQAIGRHWSQSHACDYRDFSGEQKEILTGLLMGDGSINKHERGNPRVQVSMINKEYLKYIDNLFPKLGNGVSLLMNAEESAKESRERGFDENARGENYHDIYQWRTRKNPNLNELRVWYFTGKKIWPHDIKLSPTVLKHWYCGDGYFNNNGGKCNIAISLVNERKNKEKVEKYFKEGPGVEISNWNEYERDSGHWACSIQFTIDTTEQLFNYMGSSPPGFEYKWPDQ